jgi:hypothetical protein
VAFRQLNGSLGNGTSKDQIQILLFGHDRSSPRAIAGAVVPRQNLADAEDRLALMLE